jgi:hypothetical protein
MARTTLRVPRSRGAFSGVLLILLGIWGGLVPMVGPYLHYAYTPDHAWTVTNGRIWLEFAPAAGAVLGGIMMLASKFRHTALAGASLAVISGAWFAFGSLLSRLWMHTPPAAGNPVGGSFAASIEQIGFFTGLGAVIICVAAVALGRLSVISVRDIRLAERAERERAERERTEREPAEREPALPAPSTGTGATTTTTPARKAPLAVLTRIASRSKPDDQTTDTGVTSRRERVSSGT